MAEINKINVGGTNYDVRDAGATRTSVMPNDNGEIKTKYRIAKKDYTNGATWYYEICKLPKNDSGNYASAIISGRIGGWESGNMSYINALIWNRGTPGLAVIDVGGTTTAASNIWSLCDLVLYTNSDRTATLYAKCANWFTFDLDLELFQSTASITYSGNKLTSVSGTLNKAASATTSRMELINGELYVAGTKMPKADTWRGIQDNLTSTSTTDSLSAKQGKELKTLVDGKLSTSGGTISGNLTITDSLTVNTKLYGPQIGSNPRNQYDSGLYFFNCDPNSTSNYNFGLYQWINKFQFTTRTASNNVYKATAFEIDGDTGTTSFSVTPTVNGTAVSLNGHTHDYAASNHTHTTNAAIYVDSSNRLHAAGFYADSDRRLKENIKEFIPQKSILELPVVEFDFKNTKQHTMGCIAQDLQEICPEIVYTNDKGFLSIEESKLTYLLLLELKKLKSETEELKAEIDKLKKSL